MDTRIGLYSYHSVYQFQYHAFKSSDCFVFNKYSNIMQKHLWLFTVPFIWQYCTLLCCNDAVLTSYYLYADRKLTCLLEAIVYKNPYFFLYLQILILLCHFLNRELAKQLGDKGVIVFEDVKDVIMKSKWKISLQFSIAVTHNKQKMQNTYLWNFNQWSHFWTNLTDGYLILMFPCCKSCEVFFFGLAAY